MDAADHPAQAPCRKASVFSTMSGAATAPYTAITHGRRATTWPTAIHSGHHSSIERGIDR